MADEILDLRARMTAAARRRPGRRLHPEACNDDVAGAGPCVADVAVAVTRLRYAHVLCDLAEDIHRIHPEAARLLDRAAGLLLQS